MGLRIWRQGELLLCCWVSRESSRTALPCLVGNGSNGSQHRNQLLPFGGKGHRHVNFQKKATRRPSPDISATRGGAGGGEAGRGHPGAAAAAEQRPAVPAEPRGHQGAGRPATSRAARTARPSGAVFASWGRWKVDPG